MLPMGTIHNNMLRRRSRLAARLGRARGLTFAQGERLNAGLPRMPETIGKFQVLGELGKGAHSTLYHIRRLSDSRQFALKMVPIEDKEDAKYHEQAQLEFRVGQMLDHVNLIKVYALETQRDWFFRVRK